MIALEIIFWACALLIGYSYVAYPMLTSLLMLFHKTKHVHHAPAALPRVFVVFAAYNEEEVISKKLESIMASDYPKDKLYVWVGSDCSTDRTNEIITAFATKHAGIKLRAFTDRTGKTGILNKLVDEYREQAEQNDILVLTDANVMFEPPTVVELVKQFGDEAVGLVGANVLNPRYGAGISTQERAYIQRENRIKFREGALWGAVMGAFGACYAIRAELFPKMPPNTIVDDFFVTMHVLRRRKKAIIAPNAVCIEDVSVKVGQEFRRKRRISVGNFQNLSRYWTMLFSFRPAGFAFWSHKVLRWLGPFLLIGALATSGILALESTFYLVLFLVHAGLIALGLLDLLLQQARLSVQPLRLLSYFYAMNLALLAGFFMFLGGVSTSVWRPTERTVT